MQGTDLKEFRVLNNLTQAQLARVLGLSQNYVSQIESGYRVLSDEKLALLTNEKMGYVLPGGFASKTPSDSLISPMTAFRKANGLSQQDVADYLGIKKAYCSLMENGKAKISADKIQKLVNNNKGWNTEALNDMINSNNTTIRIGDNLNHSIKGNNNVSGTDKTAVLVKEIEYLKKLLEEKERTIQTLTNILTKQ